MPRLTDDDFDEPAHGSTGIYFFHSSIYILLVWSYVQLMYLSQWHDTTETDLAEEVQNFLGYGNSIETTETEEIRSVKEPTESEVALSMRLKYDKEAGSDEIVPCCTYFFWGTYIACCTGDVNTLKLLGVYVEKPRDMMDFEHSRLYVTRVKATGVQSAEFTGWYPFY